MKVKTSKSSISPSGFNFIVVIRAVAALLILWCHLVGEFTNNHKISWLPYSLVSSYVDKPLNIIGGFGFFSVCLFFLVSGFLMGNIKENETRKTYTIKKIFRIFPAIICTYFLVWAVQGLLKFFGCSSYWNAFSFSDWILGATLGRYLVWQGIGGEPINAPTWFLFVEILYYIICGFFLTLIKKSPKLFIVCVLVLELFNQGCPFLFKSLFYVCRWFSYIVFIVFGQLLYYAWNKQINFKYFIGFSLINYVIMIRNLLIFDKDHYTSFPYGVNFLYAYFIFIIMLLLNDKIKVNNITENISKISFSTYLIHDPFGNLILVLLTQNCSWMNYTFSLAIALIVVFILSVLQYKYIEQNSKKLALKIINHNVQQ